MFVAILGGFAEFGFEGLKDPQSQILVLCFFVFVAVTVYGLATKKWILVPIAYMIPGLTFYFMP